MHAGELTVTGKHKIDLPLSENPEKIEVYFIDEHHHHHVPCNPHTDQLGWFIRKIKLPRHHHREYVLTIMWDVAGVRKIGWKVFF